MICQDYGEDVCRCDVAQDMRAFDKRRNPPPTMNRDAKRRIAAAHARARAAETAPIDMVTVKEHPDYGITPAGEVWRLTPTSNHHRVPRRISWIYQGGINMRYPHVRFYDGPKPTVRSISWLLGEHFPDNP